MNVLKEASVCILGLLSTVLFHFIGDMYVTEILVIISFPVLILVGGRHLLSPGLKPIFPLLGIWFVGLILSDAYRKTEMVNRLRGMALIVFFAVQIAAFAIIFIGNERRKTIFLIAYAVGALVVAKVQPTAISEGENRWKFGYATGAIMLAVLVSSFFYARRKYVPAGLCFVAIAGYNLLVNYRSAFLEILVTAVLVVPIIPQRVGRIRFLPRKRGFAHVLIVAMIALIAGWTAGKIVTYASSTGLLGEDAQEKNEEQATAGNLILGGRPEVFTGLKAVADSPIVGYGSWPEDPKYLEMELDLMAEQGRRRVNWQDQLETGSWLIPSHSHIVGAWVFAGILGPLFWIYLLWLVVRGIFWVSVLRPPLAPIYCYLFISMFWNILFSPFGSFERTFEAFTVVVIVDLLKDKPTNVSGLRLPKGRWRRSAWVRSSLIAPIPKVARF